MQHIWKIRLALIVSAFGGLGLMAYCFEQAPQNDLAAVLAFLIFFANAMILLATASVESATDIAKRQRSVVSPEHRISSTGGSGGSSGC